MTNKLSTWITLKKAERSEEKSEARSFASITLKFLFLTRSFASHFLLLAPRTTNWWLFLLRLKSAFRPGAEGAQSARPQLVLPTSRFSPSSTTTSGPPESPLQLIIRFWVGWAGTRSVPEWKLKSGSFRRSQLIRRAETLANEKHCVKAVPFRTRLPCASVAPFLSRDTDRSAWSSSFRGRDFPRIRSRLEAGIEAHQLSRLWFARVAKNILLNFLSDFGNTTYKKL